MASRLKEKYQKEVIPALMEKFNYDTPMQVPKIEKIVLNMGVGEAKDNIKILEKAVEEMTIISGQKPVVTKSKKSVSNFKIRAGMPIGCKVVLRKEKMFYFMDKFVNIALPRVRDFRGIPKTSFDGRGNYSVGIREQLIFPEIKYDDVETIRGMNIVFTTTANTDEEARELLSLMGMPFKK